jgi:ketosteroid isomerase-like protein
MENTPAVQTALAYYDAWTAKDLDRAMEYVADDIRCDAPAGRIEGADAYRAFLAPLVGMLVSAELIAVFGDGTTAMIMYDTRTSLVESGPGAECVTVIDGRIVASRFIFDRLPFAAARQASAQ